jgi:hypothetical protein
LSPATLRVQQANYNRPGYDQDRRRSQEYSLPETQFAGESIRHNAQAEGVGSSAATATVLCALKRKDGW